MSETRDTKTGQITGTTDADFDLFRYIENNLETALRMETYRRDAERAGDTALAALFTMTQNDSRKAAEIGKKLLVDRLIMTAPDEAAGGSAGHATGRSAESATGRSTEQTRRTSAEQSADNPPIDVMAPSGTRENQQGSTR